MGRRSGIKIYKDGSRKRSGKERRVSLWILQWCCASLLACAWWNLFLDVFPSGIGKGALFCTLILAGAVLQFLNIFGWKAVVPVLGAGVITALWPGREMFTDFFLRVADSVSFVVSAGTPGVESAADLAQDPLRMGVAAGLVTVPVLEIWLLVLKSGRGRIPAGVLMTAPLIGNACGGFIGTSSEVWSLILAGGVYFACGTAGGTGQGRNVSCGKNRRYRKEIPGREAWAGAVMAFLILSVTALLASQAGRLLDRGRDVPGGYYQTARSFLTTELVGAVEEMIYGPPEERETPGESGAEEEITEEPVQEPDSTDGMEQPVPGEEDTWLTENGETPPAVDFTGDGMLSSSSMDHLKDLEAYVPSEAELSMGIIREERPVDTVYVPVRYGLEYNGDSWDEITEEELADIAAFFHPVWPDDLERLPELCRGWEELSVEEVGARIDEAFAELAVYDTHPGATPDDQDFVEYFLFENHRGFCVHFASAATLLYQMSGQTAVYVEGYAVPPSAFQETEEGGPYSARIDGTMGHAWCQTFDEQTSQWTVREHTPASTGSAVDNGGEEGKSGASASWERAGRYLIRIFAVLAGCLLVLGALGAVLVLQAVVRRKRKERIFLEKSAERGISAMYRSIRQTAGRRGVEIGDPYGENAPHILAEAFPALDAEEWQWLCSCAVRNLFYHLEAPETDRKKMHFLYTRFIRNIYSELNPRERFLYRYIYII